jgi:integrase
LNLKAARAESQRLKAQLEQGHNPKIVRDLEKQAILKADSVESLFRQWYENYCKKNKKGHHDVMRSFELHVFPRIGHLPADKVGLHEWLDLLEKNAAVRPGIADRILTNAKQMLKWGVKRRLIPANHLVEINARDDLQIKKVAGSRSLSPEEVTHVWKAIVDSRMATKNKIYMKLCLIYGCRNGELRAAERAHLDFKKCVWTIPPANHKLGKATGKPLLRPLLPATERLFKEALALSQGSSFVFTNAGSDKPMGTSAPLALPYNIMQWLRRREGVEMAHWSIHDLRKTARTNFSTLTEPHVAEIMLGHRLPGSWQVYDHHDYLHEQGRAYESWIARLRLLTGDLLAASEP